MPSRKGVFDNMTGQERYLQGPPITINDDDRKTLILQDAKIMGDRIQWYLQQHERIETLGLFSTGAVWSFILSQRWGGAIAYLAWIPAFITFTLAVKSYLFTRTINEAFQYLYEIEEAYELPVDRGWVHYFRHRSSRYKRRWRNAFWAALLLINVLVPLFFPFQSILSRGRP